MHFIMDTQTVTVLGWIFGSGILATFLGFVYNWWNSRGEVKFTEYQIAMNYVKPSWGRNYFRYFILNLRFENFSKKKRTIKIDKVLFWDREKKYELAFETSLKPVLKLEERDIQELPFKVFCQDLIDVTECVNHFSEAKMELCYFIDGKPKHRFIKGERLSLNELDTVYVDV